ncbi:sigma-70 family RNA polymerase sigma factor [Desulfobacula toluolica]|uniref:Uncharacterized protein n=1 Tax=Desulfobacula toluolica (strain DSM 7467 / Tol2) TaxID=651182 RepID=K0N9Q4_DESTT|nr:sigma-70 family RNA polymerase sigma factor [Desulfobacula toluolica]CCK80699.1 uncharacterized protein TOL2_C25400 [Desulfobacula toluolica Tol2]
MSEPATELLSKKNIENIEKKCRYNFSDENESHECFNYIMDALKDNDYKRLRSFCNKSSPATYINVICNNLVIDFKRKKYGKRRFPAAVSKMGKWAEAVYRYVCWQKFTYDDAFDFLKADNLFSGTYEEYLHKIEPFGKVRCRENPQFVMLEKYYENFKKNNNPVKNNNLMNLNPLDQIIEQLELEQRTTALAVISKITSTLTENERFIIDKVYGSNMTLKSIARTLGITEAKMRTKRKELLLKYKQALHSKGIRKF